jgi:proteasome component ECM29
MYRYQNTWKEFLEDRIEKLLDYLYENLVHPSTTEQQYIGIVHVFAELARYKPLSSIFENEGASNAVLEKLQTLVKESSKKTQEYCILALGQIGLGDTNLALKIHEFFITLPSVFSKNVDIQLVVGEALAMMTGRWKATNTTSYLDITDTELEESVNDDYSQALLRWCFNESLPTSKPVNRKAVCMWLLCLLSYCKDVSVIQKSLKEIHDCFSLMLSDRDGNLFLRFFDFQNLFKR